MDEMSEHIGRPSKRFRQTTFTAIFIGVLVGINLFAVILAWSDIISWGAVGIAFIYGPIVNGAIALCSLLSTSTLKRRCAEFSRSQHIVLSIGLPLAAAVIDAGLIIYRMGR